MRKRILCMLLTAAMLLSLIPVFALPSRAASNLKTGEACIEILKQMEGFSKYAYADHGHYSIGYGSSCEKDEYPNGITEEQADALLREYLVEVEAAVNRFANRYEIHMPQYQFDALILFTYNVGPNWVNSDGEFRQAVIEGAAGNDYIYALTLWSTAGGSLSMGLLNRRLIEADMYLNGSYANECPSHYTYVVYDNHEGVAQSRAQGYDCNLSAVVKSLPTREGYRFLGWYSQAEGGSWITELTAANSEQTLHAHWQAADVAPDSGTAAFYQIAADQLVSLDTYDVPGGKVVGSLNEDTLTTVIADYVDAKGMKWGRVRGNAWVKLGDPLIGTYVAPQEESGVKVTVTGDYVNVRVGPGTNYEVVSGVTEGDELIITRVVDVKGTLWGQFRGGWICLQYTNYSGGLTPGQPAPETPETNPDPDNGSTTVIATGTITADVLNIRGTPGTAGKVVGAYQRGNKVEILQKTVVNGVEWGRTVKGWISMQYVKLDAVQVPEDTTAPTEPETTVPETTEPETTAPETTVPEESVPETTVPEQEEAEPQQGIPATVISKGGLNIRKGPGTNYASSGAYRSGELIQILEQQTVGGMTWGRTDKGWVSMQYVRLHEIWTNENGVYGTVISKNGLIIRSGTGVGFTPCGNYLGGQRILIFEQTVVGGQKWGRTDKGWVCMDYVRLEEAAGGTDVPAGTTPQDPTQGTEPETPEQPEQTTVVTGVITAGGLNIRYTPGASGAIVGGYQRGQRVTILEQTVINGTTWGRTDRGWISMSYVKLDEPEMEAGDTGTITASSLCIRSGPGTANAVVGVYYRGQVVTILETTKVGATRWGRTDLGWICMDYVK